MKIAPIVLEGQHVRLEPLTRDHAESLVAAAGDGELWNSDVTVVPSPQSIHSYMEAALLGLQRGSELPFAIVRKATGVVVGTTRFYEIQPADRRAAIGYTWLATSAQRTPINTEAKLLLLQHAFDDWGCVRVEFITDVLNQQSRAAILRLGAKQEGILRNHMIMPSGRIRDSVFFSVIAEEWPDVKAKLEAKLNRF
jgi:RimJ/RimL family protein N-acetyltransferase